jgi:acetolactate synthase small subunit
VTGAPEEIDEFLRDIKPIGVEEMSRTGATALERGTLRLA